ncbi:MAG: TonB-dependent receptor [Bacteroidota bacterium]
MDTILNKGFGYGLLMLAAMLAAAPAQGYAAKNSADTLKHPPKSPAKPVSMITTATRLPELLSAIPCPALLLKNTGFKYNRDIGAADLLTAVPGLFIQSHWGGQDTRYSLRGYGNGSNAGATGVLVMVDNIPETETDGQTPADAVDFQSTGRIEVVRGDASSFYPHAPGGVINFISDLDFKRSSVLQYNEFGSFGLLKNGIRAAVKMERSRILASYSNLNYDGYRQHNNEYRQMLNLAMETSVSGHSRLTFLGYFNTGAVKLPGALTQEEFAKDPLKADPRSVAMDEKGVATNGRVALRYHSAFGKKLQNEIEVTAFSRVRFLEYASLKYNIVNKYTVGLDGRYVNKSMLGNRHNELSVGVDFYAQPTRTEEYKNIRGVKQNQIQQVTSENISGKGLYLSDHFEIIRKKLFALVTGRFDQVSYRQAQQTLPSLSGSRSFDALNPKLALNYQVTTGNMLFCSFGRSLENPALYETGTASETTLLNQEVHPAESMNFELGARSAIALTEHALPRRLAFEVTLFNTRVTNEIIPYEIQGSVYYRNAASSVRRGIETAARLDISKGLAFGITYTWTDFTYLSYEAAAITATPAGNKETTRDFSGNRLPGVPVNNLNLTLTWSQAAGSHFHVFLEPGCRVVSGLWADDANTARTSAYHLLKAVAGLDFKYGKFSLMASGGVDNLLNETYAGYLHINATDQRFYEAGAPRNYFASLNLGYSF